MVEHIYVRFFSFHIASLKIEIKTKFNMPCVTQQLMSMCAFCSVISPPILV